MKDINLRQDAPSQVSQVNPTRISEEIEKLQAVQQEIINHENKVKELKDQVGFIFYLKNTCLGIEFFNSPILYSKYSKKLIRSILIDAIELETSKDPYLKYQTSFSKREIKDKLTLMNVTFIKYRD